MNAPLEHDTNCACGSGNTRVECCGPYLAGTKLPPTAESCMRSRYSAYVEGALEYILQSWHPSTRPKAIEPSPKCRWLGLTIKRTEKGMHDDMIGEVEFVARYRVQGRGSRLHENSQFKKDQQRWFYLNGTTTGR